MGNEFRELVLGATPRLKKKRYARGGDEGYKNPTYLDMFESPDVVVWDLNVHPLPFEDNTFDEIHAYEVLEHLSKQGDWKFFFDEFAEYWRILKPDGYMFISVPRWDRMWAYCDPGHTRVLQQHVFNFLDPIYYEENLKEGTSSDYSSILKCNFRIVGARSEAVSEFTKLKAIKNVG
jgi:SAM-dependent methyltransferase